jgi:hypothetical protein
MKKGRAVYLYVLLLGGISLYPVNQLMAAEPQVSEATKECIGCHASVTPGIVGDWQHSLHSKITPKGALAKEKLARRVSAPDIPEVLQGKVVGCAECHMLNPESHKDTFDHNGFSIHIVVSPKDCATCHPEEEQQYALNIMSQAYGNLKNNPLYHGLVDSINGLQTYEGGETSLAPADELTNADACFSCHGTVIEVQGMKTAETVMGEMDFPVLTGWPNQGVGRINTDGSKGSCTSCHPRHSFSIEVARQPYTCSQCHKGPDVPAYKVYSASKHGNIFSSTNKKWDFSAVPWTIGKDITAPTCATCHVSLLVSGEGEVIVERTHQMNNRLDWRLLGLPYAHAHPKSPDTSIIKNKAGLTLPTELTGEQVDEFLIDKEEMAARRTTMQKVCKACHSQQWVNGHFARLDNTIKTTNAMTLTATTILLSAWDKGLAKGLKENDSIFNEAIEKMWVREWLFYANTTRLASAMAGADYGVFANGRWFLAENIQVMKDWHDLKLKTTKKGWFWKDIF